MNAKELDQLHTDFEYIGLTTINLEVYVKGREKINDYNVGLGAIGASGAIDFDTIDKYDKEIKEKETALRTQLIEINRKVLPEREEAIEGLESALGNVLYAYSRDEQIGEFVGIVKKALENFDKFNH